MANTNNFGQSSRDATIAIGQNTSGALEVGGLNPCKILLPATTGTSFTFQSSENGTDWFTLRDATGAPVTVTKQSASDTGFYQLEPALFAGLPGFIRIVSSANEVAQRAFTIFSQCTVSLP